MSLRSRVRALLRNLLSAQAAERELDSEVRAYFEDLVAEQIAAGATPEEARRRAAIEMGGIEQVKESVREVRAGATLDSVLQDAGYALRMLVRNPGFTAIAVLTLGIGIGANTAIFSVVNAALLRPLPYPHAERLAIVWSVYGGEGRAPAAGPEYAYLREHSRAFEALEGIWVQSAALTGSGEPEQVKLGLVTAGFLPLLSARPQLGRYFRPEEQGSGRVRVGVLSDRVWRRRFGADPGLIGKAVQLDGSPLTIVGVLPPGFKVAFPEGSSVPPEIDIFIPFPNELAKDPADQAYIRVVGRLRSGVSLAQAQQDAAAQAVALRAQFGGLDQQRLGIQIAPLHDDVVRSVRPALLALFGGVALVALIACVNVANLLLARAGGRERELALRSSLGATPGRIVRQLLTESLVLSVLGGGAALLVGWLALRSLLLFAPDGLARVGPIALDPAVLAFTLGLSIGVGLLFGLVPARGAARMGAGAGARVVAGGRNTRKLLIVGEVALGFVLLIGAGLMMRTLAALLRADPGFDSARVLTFQVALPESRYPKPEQAVRFVRELQRGLASLPGVDAVGMTSHLPFDDELPNWYSYYWPEGAPSQLQNTRMADHRSVLPGYLESIGARLVAGRTIDEFDLKSGRKVAVIDSALAEQGWPDASAVGQKLNVENGQFVRDTVEVIGVVRHVQHHSLALNVRPQVFLPFPLAVRANVAFTLHTAGDPLALAPSVRQQVARLDKDLPAARIRPLDDYLAAGARSTRFTTRLAEALAAIALILACIGIYGVSSCGVRERRSEIGVRLALGARTVDILGLVLRQGMAPILAGGVIGLVAALALTPLISSLLFGVQPGDPATLVLAAVSLLASGLLACLVPALRAAALDPTVALRHE